MNNDLFVKSKFELNLNAHTSHNWKLLPNVCDITFQILKMGSYDKRHVNDAKN